jgi:hypothetical protein
VKCFRETGRCSAKPRGGSTSPLEQHADFFLLALIEDEPDMTLDEVLSAMRKHKVPGSRTAVWRFFQRHKITFKKALRAAEQKRADVARARRRWMQNSLMRLLPTPRWCGCMAVARAASGWSAMCRRGTERQSTWWRRCVVMA